MHAKSAYRDCTTHKFNKSQNAKSSEKKMMSADFEKDLEAIRHVF